MSAIRDEIMSVAQGRPEVKQAADQIEARLQGVPIDPDQLAQIIHALEFVLQNPKAYPQVRAKAIQDGLIQPNELPEQFDIVLVIALLVAMYELQDRASQGMAHGGLVSAARRLAAAGRGGDTELVHVNSKEKEMLERMGGSGTVNPNTGLKEYKGGVVGSILSVAVPVASMLLSLIHI